MVVLEVWQNKSNSKKVVVTDLIHEIQETSYQQNEDVVEGVVLAEIDSTDFIGKELRMDIDVFLRSYRQIGKIPVTLIKE